MKVSLTPSQLKKLVKNTVNQRLSVDEQDSGTDPSSQQPQSGTSDKQGGGQGYPEVTKWESGVERGPGNQIAVTKWSDIVGSKLERGKANELK